MPRHQLHIDARRHELRPVPTATTGSAHGAARRRAADSPETTAFSDGEAWLWLGAAFRHLAPCFGARAELPEAQ